MWPLVRRIFRKSRYLLIGALLCLLAEDVASLLKMMVLFDREEQAGLLQTNFQQLITTIEQSINIIWPPEEASVNQAQVSQVGTGGEKCRPD